MVSSAFTSHPENEIPRAGTADPRCVPIKLKGPIPVGEAIPYPNYADAEHEIWRTLFDRQMTLLPGRAADEFISGLTTLGLERERIPALASVSRRLESATGWRVARTPGLLDAHDFFSHLARRIFPCTDYIRTQEELDYTPAPDCFHDIFGHTPMIMHPRFADFYQRIGEAALACPHPAIEEGLTRIYWFTVEFGLIQNPAGLRIYGNGIISSYGETQHSLMDQVMRKPFDPEEVAATAYDIWHFQDVLFVIESFDQLGDAFDGWVRRNIGDPRSRTPRKRPAARKS
jgi:phenylalanine-4-hydroxylase